MTKENKPNKNKEVCVKKAYVEVCGEISDVLREIEFMHRFSLDALNDSSKKKGEINWGDVGELSCFLKKALELSEQMRPICSGNTDMYIKILDGKLVSE